MGIFWTWFDQWSFFGHYGHCYGQKPIVFRIEIVWLCITDTRPPNGPDKGPVVVTNKETSNLASDHFWLQSDQETTLLT